MKEIEITVGLGKALDAQMIRETAAKALGVRSDAVGECAVLRRSIDARKDPLWRYRIAVCRKGEDVPGYEVPPYRDVSRSREVIIVGSGPAGMFAALRLLQEGYRPVILERGSDVHSRKVDIASLSTGVLHGEKLPEESRVNPDSNYCYGEGGAGTFSDGKLFTRSSKRGDIREVLHQLVSFGADESILIDAHPHIGSDRLPAIVEDIRKCIVEHGGEYHFGTRVDDIRSEGGLIKVCAGDLSFSAQSVILATGHSAVDIYEMLEHKGWALEAKGFALGVRVEHRQSLINQIQYHGKYQPYMPAAEYSFVTQMEGRGVFSFCMCPGGVLVPSASGAGEVVLNGMSNSGRTGKMANSGVVVSVEPEDFPEHMSEGPLGMLRMQKEVERRMFDYSGSLKAPAQRMMDFCRRIESRDLPATTYVPGAVTAPLHSLLPPQVSDRLKHAFPMVGNKLLHGYYTNDALLLGVESRTSSPVRIPRDRETLQYVSLPGLYPCGEGAGYSGGIVSSALDGIRCAAAIASASFYLCYGK